MFTDPRSNLTFSVFIETQITNFVSSPPVIFISSYTNTWVLTIFIIIILYTNFFQSARVILRYVKVLSSRGLNRLHIRTPVMILSYIKLLQIFVPTSEVTRILIDHITLRCSPEKWVCVSNVKSNHQTSCISATVLYIDYVLSRHCTKHSVSLDRYSRISFPFSSGNPLYEFHDRNIVIDAFFFYGI